MIKRFLAALGVALLVMIGGATAAGAVDELLWPDDGGELAVQIVEDLSDPRGDGSGMVGRGAYFQCAPIEPIEDYEHLTFGAMSITGYYDHDQERSEGYLTVDISEVVCDGKRIEGIVEGASLDERNMWIDYDSSIITYLPTARQSGGLGFQVYLSDGSVGAVGMSAGSIVPPAAPLPSPPFTPETGDPEPEPTPEPEPEPAPDPPVVPEEPEIELPEEPVVPEAPVEPEPEPEPTPEPEPVVPFAPDTGIEVDEPSSSLLGWVLSLLGWLIGSGLSLGAETWFAVRRWL